MNMKLSYFVFDSAKEKISIRSFSGFLVLALRQKQLQIMFFSRHKIYVLRTRDVEKRRLNYRVATTMAVPVVMVCIWLLSRHSL